MASVDDRYRETAEMPFLPYRQARMLEILHSRVGTLDDLMDLLYRIAEEDQELCIQSQVPDDVARVRSGAEMMIHDHNDTCEMVELLRSIPKSVIEAIIDNTVGHKYSTVAAFRDLFMERDDCAGVYLNTFVVKTEGKGLTSNEWQRLQQMMQRYIDGECHIITSGSSVQHKRDAVEAASIDHKYDPSHRLLEKCRDDARGGKRRMVQKKGGQQFCDMLSKRVRTDLDPAGNVRHLQMPVQVGCSTSLAASMQRFDPKTGMKQVPLTWQLTISCLAVMGVQVEIVSLPILKIWKHQHFKLAEVLETLLGGSLIEWGGFNPIAAGGKGIDANVDLSRERRQVLTEYPWASENIDSSIQLTRERRDALQLVNELADPEEKTAAMRGRLDQTKKISQRVQTAIDDADSAISEVQRATTLLEEHNDRLSSALAKKQGYANFRDNVQGWLRKANGAENGQG